MAVKAWRVKKGCVVVYGGGRLLGGHVFQADESEVAPYLDQVYEVKARAIKAPKIHRAILQTPEDRAMT